MTAVSMDERQGRGTRWAVALATFLVFAIAGPLIGGGLLLAALIGLDSVPPGFVGYSLNAYVFATGTVLLPIVVSGLLVALLDGKGTPAGATLASSIGATVAAAWGLFLAAIGAAATLAMLAFVGTVVAALACWRLTRWPVRAP